MAYRVTRASVSTDTDVTALADNETNGIWVRTGSGTGAARTITGTANEITVADGSGVGGNPTLSIPSALTLTGKTVTGGTFASPTASGNIAGTPTVSGTWTFNAAPIISTTSATLKFQETDQAANAQRWALSCANSIFVIRASSDDELTNTNAISITRSGTTITNIATTATNFTHTGILNVTGVVNVTANGAATNITGWTATDTDIDGLIAGSTFGTLIKSTPAGHFTFGLQDNDASDGFQFVTGGGNYTADFIYDTLAFSIGSTGNVFVAGTLDIGAATDTTVSRLSAGQLAVEGVQVATATNSLAFTNKSLTSPTITGTIAGTPAVASAWAFSTSPTVPTPTGSTDAANKAYVDSVAVGLQPKTVALCASTGNLGLSGTASVDGVTIIAGDRVLAKDQTTASQNGIYVVAAGAWSRATDMDVWSETIGAIVPVTSGTANGSKVFVSTAVAGGTIGSTSFTFTLLITTSGLQPLDSDLTEIAALTTTAYGRSVLTSADAAALRTLAGAVIGTDVQAYDADLGTWAAVTRAAGFDTFATTPTSANLAALVTGETGSGDLVFATSPTLVTPALGTPSAAVLTNATGLPVATGISGLGTGVATLLATPSSANLAAAITDETGTGALVFATSPTLVTPALGTPASAVLTNATGLPVSTGIDGLGANVATFLTTPSSANLAAAVTGETGSGALVFATSPTLVTPVLGTPTSATLTNATGLPISTGVSGLGSGVATFLATPSSANLKTAVSDETGSGALVFATDPILVTPNIGTPSAAVLTNATGLPISSGVSGLGTGVATFLATPSSTNLRTAITDETGSGSLVFATSPTLATPTLTNPVVNAGSGAIVLPAAASPAQTAEGSAVWDSDDDKLTVGTGAGRVTMVDTASAQTISSKSVTATGGSVARTIEAHRADEINVLDHCATVDGATDNTTGITAALALGMSSGKPVRFRKGTGSYITEPQNCASAVNIILDPGVTVKLKNSATVTSNSLYVFRLRASNSSLMGGTIDFNRDNNDRAGYNAALGAAVRTYWPVYVLGTSDSVRIENIRICTKVINSADYAVASLYANNVDVSGTTVEDSGAGVIIKNFTTCKANDIQLINLDNADWLISPNAIDIKDGDVAECNNLLIENQAGYNNIAGGLSRSDWFQGVGILNVRKFHGDNWRVTALNDSTMTKSVGISLLYVTDASITNVTCERYTSVGLEIGGCRNLTVKGDVIDGGYLAPDATMWPPSASTQGNGIHAINGGLYESRARVLAPNINCHVEFNMVTGHLGPGMRTYIGSGLRVENTVFEGNLYGVFQESSNVNDSFPTAETQVTEDGGYDNCDFVYNEGAGFYDEGGTRTLLNNCRFDNNGQARNATVAGTTRFAVETIDATEAAGYYSKDDAGTANFPIVERLDPRLLDCRTQDSQRSTSLKSAVALATTANITLSGEQTIDGTLTSASRVLVKNQTTASQNGIYVSAAGAWARATDMDVWSETAGAIVPVTGGTTNVGQYYTSASPIDGTIGTTSLTFTLYYGIGSAQPSAPRVVYVRNPAKYRKGQWIKLNGCGTASADLKTYIVSIAGDALTIHTDIITFPLATKTGTVSTTGTTLTGTSTLFTTQITSRMYLKNGSNYSLIDSAGGATAGTLLTAFSPDLSGQAVTIVEFTIEQMRSQNYGIVTNSATNDATFIANDHDFGVGNVTANTSLATPVDISLVQWATPIRLGVQDWVAQNGSPVVGLNSASTRSMWLFDAASTERIAATIRVPKNLVGVRMVPVLYWTNNGAGSGNVVWRYAYHHSTDAGATETASTFVNFAVTAAPAQDVLKITRADAFTVTADRLLHFTIDREGGSGSDTLANDAGVFAMALEVV